jgi:hypothetical protein
MVDVLHPPPALDARACPHDRDSFLAGPYYLSLLHPEQRDIYHSWYEETNRRQLIGETSISAMVFSSV